MSLMFEFFDVGFLGTLIGVVAGAFITRYYALRSFEHMESATEKTERLLRTVLRVLEERGVKLEPPRAEERPGEKPAGSPDESR